MITLETNQSTVEKSDRLSPALINQIESEINQHVNNLPKGKISVSFVSDQEIQRLNRIYRDIDKVTDVLSFSYVDTPQNRGEIGDVIISLSQAKRQQTEGLTQELVDLIVHGVLHVLGFDHEIPAMSKEMFSLQDSIVAKII